MWVSPELDSRAGGRDRISLVDGQDTNGTGRKPLMAAAVKP